MLLPQMVYNYTEKKSHNKITSCKLYVLRTIGIDYDHVDYPMNPDRAKNHKNYPHKHTYTTEFYPSTQNKCG